VKRRAMIPQASCCSRRMVSFYRSRNSRVGKRKALALLNIIQMLPRADANA
jgi:hypothetical protein